MAYTFNGSTQYLSKNIGAVVSAYPVTLFCRGSTNAAATTQILAAYIEGSGTYSGLLLFLQGGGNIAGQRFGVALNSSLTYSTGTWYSWAARSRTTTDWDVNVNNTVNTATDTKAFPPVGEFQIGARLTPAINLPLNGSVAQVALWDAALTDAEMASLVAGFSPRRIRPQSLKFYVPLVRDLTSPVTAAVPGVLTNTGGATVSNHPRTYGL